MTIWGVTIKPGHPFTHRYDRTKGKLHISQATMQDRYCSGTPLVKVMCHVEHTENPIYLCTISPYGQQHSFPLNFEFGEDDGDVVLSVSGKHDVHLAGYYLGNAGGHGEGL